MSALIGNPQDITGVAFEIHESDTAYGDRGQFVPSGDWPSPAPFRLRDAPEKYGR